MTSVTSPSFISVLYKDDMGANVNAVSLVASLFITSGAIVMAVNIAKFRGMLQILKQFAVQEYQESNWLFSLHQILIMFFLIGYVVVLYSTIMRIQIIGELFVGMIFFSGQFLFFLEYSSNRGLEIVTEYVDVGISGAKERRPELERLMADARRRCFDAVLVARFDRFARSVRHLVMALDEFNSLGIHFVSLSEAIDTSTPMGKMVFTVIGAVAELERELIRERVLMGLERARKQGKNLSHKTSVF